MNLYIYYLIFVNNLIVLMKVSSLHVLYFIYIEPKNISKKKLKKKQNEKRKRRLKRKNMWNKKWGSIILNLGFITNYDGNRGRIFALFPVYFS